MPVVASLLVQAVIVLPVPVLVALKVGTTLGNTVLLLASFKVIVIEEVVDPSAVMGVTPVIVEKAVPATPPLNKTVPPATTTGVASAIVLVSALVDTRVQVEIPVTVLLELQVPRVLPVPVLVKVGTTLGEIALLLASLKVIVMLEVEVPFAVTGPLPVIVEFPALTLPPVKTTVPPATTAGVTNARVLVSAIVEARVQVDIPVLALLLEQTLTVFPLPVLVALKVGTTLGEIALLLASLKVIVMLEIEVPFAVTGPLPVIVEFPALALPPVKTTVPPATTAGVTNARVLVSAIVEARVQVDIPVLALLLEQTLTVFPLPVLVALKVGTTLGEIALLLASLKVIVMLEVEVPFAVTGPLPVIVEFPALTLPPVKTTVPPATTAGVTNTRVLVSAIVEARVQVDIPVLALLLEQTLTVFPVPVLVALNVGTTLGEIALLLASLKVIVMLEVEVPFAVTGPLPVIVEFPALTLPPVKMTVPPATTAGVTNARVLVSAIVEARVQVDIPVLALLLEQTLTVFPVPVLVALKVGTTLGEIALLLASLKVIVMLEVEVPFAVTGPLPVIEEFPTLTLPPVKTTVPPATTAGVTNARVLVSAIVEARVQVDIPVLALLLEQTLTVFPVPVLVALKVGTTLGEIALLLASLKVIVMLEVAVPFAVTGPLPVIVEFPALTLPPVNTTVPPDRETGVTIESVLVSALSELKVQRETPLPSVVEQVR